MQNFSPKINAALVQNLVASQFPQWTNLPVQAVMPGGWDNRIFRLGEQMLVRLPSSLEYAAQVEKEHKWLPRLAPSMPLTIPEPLALGKPAEGYPWNWSIYRWLDGESAHSGQIDNLCDLAIHLAEFLVALQNFDSAGGPSPGKHNFFRGGALTTYDTEVRQALISLKDKIDVFSAIKVWEEALLTTWDGLPMWVHGDISAGNLLVHDGRLSAVIDFGMLAIGDPACDLAIAWTLFRGESRKAFRSRLDLDTGTWARGLAWALWKALITVANSVNSSAPEAVTATRVIDEVLVDHRCR